MNNLIGKKSFTYHTRSNRHFLRWAMIPLFVFILASFILINIASHPTLANGQSSAESAGGGTYLPLFMMDPPPPAAVYNPKRAAYVTNVVDLAP